MRGGERHADFTYPDTEYFYWVCAERFGWTPSQVDEQPAYLLDSVLRIATINDEVQSEKMERN
jgi:hypothetical protein